MTGTARVSEGMWRRAVLRRGDCVSACSCKASVRFDPDDPGAACWNCGHIPPRPPLLRLPAGTVVLADGAVVTSHHLRRDRDHETIIGSVEAHPADPARVVLRNVGSQPWTMEPEGSLPRPCSLTGDSPSAR